MAFRLSGVFLMGMLHMACSTTVIEVADGSTVRSDDLAKNGTCISVAAAIPRSR